MFNRRQVSSETASIAVERGWGPFSGRQLATIIVALIVALLVPTAAFAFSVSHTAVTDAVTKVTANVDATGALQTSEAGPASFYANSVGLRQNGPTIAALATPFGGQALIVTSIHVDSYLVKDGYDLMNFWVSTDPAGCTNDIANLDALDPATDGATVLPYVPGYAIPAGDALCANIGGGNTDSAAVVTTIGYTVPGSTVPFPAARHGAPPRPGTRP